jgi:hypothetical protein
MKLFRAPVQGQGDWWTVTHDLTPISGRTENLRPIHVFTFMAQHIVPKPDQRGFMYSLCQGLENKLAAVRLDDLRTRRAWGAAVAPGIDPHSRVQSYESHQEIIAALAGYLGAIYAVLETVAFINQLLNPKDKLKQGFSDQAKQVADFGFAENPWLPVFYDLRTQMTHLVSIMPIPRGHKFVIEFTHKNRLLAHTVGKKEFDITDVLDFTRQLFNMLDGWAATLLTRVDREEEVDCFEEQRRGERFKVRKTKLGEILDQMVLMPPETT